MIGKAWYKKHGHVTAGIDEAGRGPLAGPVVAAAVVLDSSRPINCLDDSKKLSPEIRLELFSEIWERALSIGIARISESRIDQMNILRASLEAMSRAFFYAQRNYDKKLSFALVDGIHAFPTSLSVVQYPIVRGDTLWQPIMAASVVAKVVRDKWMAKAAKRFPGYGFEKHKGYATKEHFLALKKLGPCPIHRRSFRPISTWGS